MTDFAAASLSAGAPRIDPSLSLYQRKSRERVDGSTSWSENFDRHLEAHEMELKRQMGERSQISVQDARIALEEEEPPFSLGITAVD